MPKKRAKTVSLPIVEPNAAVVDVGATQTFVAVPPERDPDPVRCFNTFTADLEKVADWLLQCQIRSVAMESTGVYWIPKEGTQRYRQEARVFIRPVLRDPLRWRRGTGRLPGHQHRSGSSRASLRTSSARRSSRHWRKTTAIAHTAKQRGISLRTLQYRLKEYNLEH